MAKAPKFDDVKRPGKVAPPPTARPIIVGNHSLLTKDPMMAPTNTSDPTEAKDESAGGSAMIHERKIQPITLTAADLEEDKKKEEETKPAVIESVPGTEDAADGTETTEKSNNAKPTEESEPKVEGPSNPELKSESALPTPVDEIENIHDPGEDADANAAAAVEAKAKRDEELETIIASGKYAVPVNAVQRRRSRITALLLCILAVLLAVALLDAIADVGVVHVPSSVPHTHFFSKQ